MRGVEGSGEGELARVLPGVWAQHGREDRLLEPGALEDEQEVVVDHEVGLGEAQALERRGADEGVLDDRAHVVHPQLALLQSLDEPGALAAVERGPHLEEPAHVGLDVEVDRGEVHALEVVDGHGVEQDLARPRREVERVEVLVELDEVHEVRAGRPDGRDRVIVTRRPPEEHARAAVLVGRLEPRARVALAVDAHDGLRGAGDEPLDRDLHDGREAEGVRPEGLELDVHPALPEERVDVVRGPRDELVDLGDAVVLGAHDREDLLEEPALGGVGRVPRAARTEDLVLGGQDGGDRRPKRAHVRLLRCNHGKDLCVGVRFFLTPCELAS